MMKRTSVICGLLTATTCLVALPAFAQSRGREFESDSGQYTFEHLCAACHMPAGVGYPGAYPALAKNPKLAVASYPITVVLNGLNAMPALGSMLNDQQVSDVVNYLRSNLNAYKPTTTPADVAAARH